MGKFSKRKKSYYLPPNKRQCLHKNILNSVGYLATCNSHEQMCVRELYTLLNQFADQIYGKDLTDTEKAQLDQQETTEESVTAGAAAATTAEAAAGEEEDSEDEDAAFKKEVAAAKETTKRDYRFLSLRCGVQQHLYIRTTLADPLPTLLAAMDDIVASCAPRSKHLVRLLPVHAVCKAYHSDIEKALANFCKKRFENKKKFYAIIKIRSTETITKDEVLGIVLKVMKECAPDCTPVLIDSDVSIVINVLKTICYISEAPLYDQYKKYNLQELASSEEKKTSAAKADSSTEKDSKKDETTNEETTEA